MIKKGLFQGLLGVMLTASLGRIQFNGHDETWYCLPMENVIAQAESKGFTEEWWIRADGCRMYSHYIVCAGNYRVHPYGSIVETSRGEGIVLDTGSFAKTNPEAIDIATVWEKGE